MSTPRKIPSVCLRAGHAMTYRAPLARRGYYEFVAAPAQLDAELSGRPEIRLDPIMLIFVGKFGTDIIQSIYNEHRFDIYTEARVWDKPQLSERLTKAVNGGLWDLHRRLWEFPRLYSALWERGFRDERRYTSVFRAITYLHDERLSVEQIASVLEESRL